MTKKTKKPTNPSPSFEAWSLLNEAVGDHLEALHRIVKSNKGLDNKTALAIAETTVNLGEAMVAGYFKVLRGV